MDCQPEFCSSVVVLEPPALTVLKKFLSGPGNLENDMSVIFLLLFVRDDVKEEGVSTSKHLVRQPEISLTGCFLITLRSLQVGGGCSAEP